MLKRVHIGVPFGALCGMVLAVAVPISVWFVVSRSLATLAWGLGINLSASFCEGAGIAGAATLFQVMTSSRAAALGLTRRRMVEDRLLALAVLVPSLIALCARWP